MSTNLFQSLVIYEACRIFGNLKLALLDLLAELPVMVVSNPLKNNKKRDQGSPQILVLEPQKTLHVAACSLSDSCKSERCCSREIGRNGNER